MGTPFNFKSQICTSREQSERLLALGLKKETADMSWFRRSKNADWESSTTSYKEWVEEILPIVDDYTLKDIIPAWSLNRIRELLKKSQVTLSFFEDGDYVVVERYGVFQNILDQRVDMWDNLCDAFLYLITEEYFNKEYLE